MENKEDAHYRIRLLTLVSLAAAGVFSVANNGALATDGIVVVTYLLIAAIGYLLPCVLVTGELGSRIQGGGGVFDWVSAGLGRRWGVAAAGAQWAQNLPFLPYAFAFAAAGVASLFDPALMSNKLWTFCVVIVFIWGGTIANLFSLKLSSRVVSAGFVLGNLLPALVLAVLAVVWLAKGQASVSPMTIDALVPDFDVGQLMIFTGVMLSLFGIDVAAPLAGKVANPRRNFPLAMGIAALVIVGGYAISVLPIVIAVPQESISLEYGTLTAFHVYFEFVGMPWLIPVMAALLVVGVISVGLVWILTPARTMQSMAARDFLPHVFKQQNKAGMPVGALIIQAVIASLFALPILFLPNVGSAFFLSLAAAAQLHLVMYLILFAAFIRVKITNIPPPGVFVIPGGKVCGVGMALLGILTCIVAFFAGFIPPSNVLSGPVSGVAIYWGVLGISLLALTVASIVVTRKFAARD